MKLNKGKILVQASGLYFTRSAKMNKEMLSGPSLLVICAVFMVFVPRSKAHAELQPGRFSEDQGRTGSAPLSGASGHQPGAPTAVLPVY